MTIAVLTRKSTGAPVYINTALVTHFDSAGTMEGSGTNIWFNGNVIWVRESLESVLHRMGCHNGSN